MPGKVRSCKFLWDLDTAELYEKKKNTCEYSVLLFIMLHNNFKALQEGHCMKEYIYCNQTSVDMKFNNKRQMRFYSTAGAIKSNALTQFIMLLMLSDHIYRQRSELGTQ